MSIKNILRLYDLNQFRVSFIEKDKKHCDKSYVNFQILIFLRSRVFF